MVHKAHIVLFMFAQNYQIFTNILWNLWLDATKFDDSESA